MSALIFGQKALIDGVNFIGYFAINLTINFYKQYLNLVYIYIFPASKGLYEYKVLMLYG